MQTKDIQKRVGILRGGAGDYYETSLKEGSNIISYITKTFLNKFKVIDIFIDKEGIWHAQGMQIKPMDLINKVDVVWDTTRPSISQVLESTHIPTFNISHFSHAMGNSKALLREHMKKIGIEMPRHIILPAYQASPVAGLRPREDFDGDKNEYAIKKAREVFEKFPAPWIVKSFNEDINIGVHIAKTLPELADAIEDVLKHQKSILVEELIVGKNAFMHTIGGFREDNIYAFPAGKFTKDEKEKLIENAKNIHNHIGATHYLKSNFVVNPQKGIYLTSVEFSPDLNPNSHLNKMCESVGTKMYHVVEHILESACHI